MATKSPIQIIEASGKWGSANMGIEDLGSVLTSQRFQGRKGKLLPIRSGSAPPNIEGSFAATENLLFMQSLATNNTGISESEEQLRADPCYLEYYWAHVNLNPRLPPPLISGENRNIFRNVRGTGSNSRLTSSDDPSCRTIWLDSNLSTHVEESEDDRLPVLEDLPQPLSSASNQSRPIIQEPNMEARNHADSIPATTTASSSQSIHNIGGNMVLKPPVNSSSNTSLQDHSPIGGVADADVSIIRSGMASVNISNFPKLENESFHVGPPQTVSLPQTYVGPNQFLQIPANFSPEEQQILPSLGFTPPHYATDPRYMSSETLSYPNMMPAGYIPQQYTIGGYAFNPPPFSPFATAYFPNNPFPTPFGNMVPSFSGQSQLSGVNMQQVNNFYGHVGLPEEHMLQSLGTMSHIDLNSRRVATTNPYYLGSPTNMDFLQFPDLPFASPLVSGYPIGGVSYPGRGNESVHGGWKGHNGNYVTNGPKTNSLLEELKTGRGRRLELSEVFGRAVEFSVDQYGSRFIQQKLEVCSNEERETIFKEVFPHASKLITDVFGNYVIQKILEHGNAEQRRVLGKLFEGQILPLSLQMYGCRVIQKAIEVFELEQRIKILHELEGHILTCVRDQNGNHVIQKCIEYLPIESYKIVISSFLGQVALLAQHPYGCRVVQRVLEHTTDRLQCQFIVDEILNVVCYLAQDQFGNYVIQYVLEAGKPEERRHIIDKLAGYIVRLSQHKYASNVVEKCLIYGDEASREMMIEEIIGSADGNDNLLVMVKDQYANYVVQKALEICSGHQREVLLSRMKVHVNSLKKYTYGKHIVARFEKLYSEEIQAAGSNSQSLSAGNLYSSGQSV